MRRVQTDKKPEPRDVYYLDEDDEEKKEKIEMEMDRKTAGIKDVAEYEPHAQTASKPSQKDASSYSFYEMMKAEAKSSSAGFPDQNSLWRSSSWVGIFDSYRNISPF